MKKNNRRFCTGTKFQKGITVIELIVVVAIMATLIAIATPWYIDWRRNMVYKTTTRDIVYMLREARSRAISQNFQHRVEFGAPDFRRYRMTQGDRVFNSQIWNLAAGQDWIRLSNDVAIIPRNALNNTMVAPNDNIAFNTNGSGAFAGDVTIQVWANPAFATPQFTITVESITGRIRVQP